jgi:polar amino acid transport system substrate-binding protein
MTPGAAAWRGTGAPREVSTMRGPSSLFVVVVAVVVAACSGDATAPPSPSSDPSTDKLAQILARGTLVGYAELDYPPQSIRVEDGARAAETKCAPNELTEPEVTGFDIETTKLVADRLGVEACFVSPTFAEVTAGGWADRLDLAYASGAINATRMENLWMTQPYYYIPQVFLVRDDAAFQVPSDLDGKRIGTCTSCTVESYLKGTLEIPGVELVQKVKDPELAGYETEFPGIQELADGKLDAFLVAEPVATEAIAQGLPLRILDEAAFSMYPSGFVDKHSSLDVAAFVARVDEIMAAAHADGSMQALSDEWFGKDYTTEAGKFDLSVLGQELP